jgi:hypothetical protein
MKTEKLEISEGCYLEHTPYTYAYSTTSLCYTERSPDPWYSDTETDIELDKTTACAIIRFLMDKLDIRKDEL